MSILLITSDKSMVTYDSWFTYTLDMSINGLTEKMKSLQIKTFIPDNIEFILPSISQTLKRINKEAVTGGYNITFDYGNIVQTGFATSLQLKCQFKLDAVEGSVFVLGGKIYINGLPHYTGIGPEITLRVVPYYTLNLNTVLPNDTSAAPGGSVVFELLLENIGDQWKEEKDIIITSQMPTGVTLDTGFEIKGKDVSPNRFIDRRADGNLAVLGSNSFTFRIAYYKGNKYSILYRAFLAADLRTGASIVDTANWQIGGVQKDAANDTLRIAAPSYMASTSFYGPNYAQAGNYINYEMYVQNTGNQDLEGVVLEVEIAPEIQGNNFTTGSFYIQAIDYYLTDSYEITYINQNDEEKSIGIYQMNQSVTINPRDVIQSGESIALVKWNLGKLPVGAMQAQAPNLNAKVKEGVTQPSKISYHTNLSWNIPGQDPGEAIYNQVTEINQYSQLYIKEVGVYPSTNVVPGDIIRYTLLVDCRYSQLNHPIIMDILSDKVEYVGDVYYEYYDYKDNVRMNTASGAFTIPAPVPTIVANYNGTGQTLVRISYTGNNAFSFRQRATLKVMYSVKVKVGAIGEITNKIMLSNEGPNGIVAQSINVYREGATSDLDGDGYYQETMAISSTMRNTINDFASIVVDKKAKGALDNQYTQYPILARSYAGGIVDYQLTIFNEGNKNIEEIELVDIIPHVGDTGVIEVDEKRQSEFGLYQVTEVQTSLFPVNQEDPSPQIMVQYSTSYNPVRFGDRGQVIGEVNDWRNTPPIDSTELGAYKVATRNTIIKPGQMLTMHAVCIVPSGVSDGLKAWNSFAVRANYTDAQGVKKYLLPVEPEKAGVEIAEPAGKYKIGGRVWADEVKDGLYNLPEIGINDVAIILYDEADKPIRSTVTAPNVLGEEGCYVFSGLEPGKYRLRFVPDTRVYAFTMQRLDKPNGSQGDKFYGVTPLVDIRMQSQMQVMQGLVRVNTMDYILKANKLANKTMRNVIYNQMLLSNKLVDTKELIDQ